MKHILDYHPSKYTENSLYTLVEGGIFEYDNPPDAIIEQPDGVVYRYGLNTTTRLEPKHFVTSLSFEQEPEIGEGSTPEHISQYPLEDILDKFNVWVSDFYTELNKESKVTCYLEFGSSKLQNMKDLREIIGKHVYNRASDEDARQIVLIIE